MFVKLLILIFIAGTCSQISAHARADTTKDWRQDLKVLESQLIKRHVNLYRKISMKKFRNAVDRLNGDIPKLSQPEILVRFAQLTAMIGDGHTSFFASSQRGKEFRQYPVRFWSFPDGIRVIAAQEEHAQLIGKRLARVDETTIEKAFAAISTTIAADNEMEYTYTVPFELRSAELLHVLDIAKSADKAMFEFTDGTRLSLPAQTRDEAGKFEWRTANKLFGGKNPPSLRLDALFATQLSAPHLMERKYYWYTYLKENRALYFQYNVSWDMPEGRASFADVTKELFDFMDKNPVERLIFDVRQNTGGEPLTAKPLIDGISARKEFSGEGRLFVLVGRRTYSAALTNAVQLRSKTGAVIVGEYSRGKPNNPSEGRDILLPRTGTVATVSTQFVERDPGLKNADYLPVDIPAAYSFEDFRSAHDRVLDVALAARIRGMR